MPRCTFLQLDVFTSQPFGGNPLAVFLDARGLSTEQMQTLAREMNFSESTFLLPPESEGAARRVRIFTPAMEMPMAGHPTVGTAAALVGRGLVDSPPPDRPSLILDLNIGPVQVDLEPRERGLPFVWMNHRLPQFGPRREDRARIAAALGLEESDLDPDLPVEVVSTGVPFLFVPICSLESIARARSETGPLASLFAGAELANVALFTRQTVDPSCRFHARMFAPHLAGIVEDAATGSMAAPFGAYAARTGLLQDASDVTFTIEQGLEMHRPSQIVVQVAWQGDTFTRLRIGGDSVLVGEGEIFWNEK
jgi:trans-2,3-dihydro-3-hydroxyanthranilate isomerase